MSDIELIRDDIEPGYNVEPDLDENGDAVPWTGGRMCDIGEREYEITGNLRTRILDRLSEDGPRVTILESHEDGGFCPTCSFDIMTFSIFVDGREVYRGDSGGYGSPFEALDDWLNEVVK